MIRPCAHHPAIQMPLPYPTPLQHCPGALTPSPISPPTPPRCIYALEILHSCNCCIILCTFAIFISSLPPYPCISPAAFACNCVPNCTLQSPCNQPHINCMPYMQLQQNSFSSDDLLFQPHALLARSSEDTHKPMSYKGACVAWSVTSVYLT